MSDADCTPGREPHSVAASSNKIESVGLRKCPYYRYLIEKVTSTDVGITNISQSLPHSMVENSWYEEITSLSPYVYLVQMISA